MNAYFTKADSSGNLVAATFLGGPSYAVGNAITADAQGNLYVEGQTGGALPGAIGTPASGGSSFAAKLTADGTKFLYVTYLPGQLSTGPAALAVDAAGSLYIGGTTADNRPIVIALTPDGSAVRYTALLDSNGVVDALTVDPAGNVVAAGRTEAVDLPVSPGAVESTWPGGDNAYVAKLDASGKVVAATYLGGNGSEIVAGVETDSAGNIFIAGMTTSSNFPTTAASLWPTPPIPPGASGTEFGFVAKLSPDATSLRYSTFMMGLGPVSGLAVNPAGEAYVTGPAGTGFPVTPSAPQPCFSGSIAAYLAHLSVDGSELLDATYVFGATNYQPMGIALSADGSVYLDENQTLAQVRFGDAAFVSPTCITPSVLNAANQWPGLAPGEFVTLAGSGIGPQTGVSYRPGPQGQIPTSTGGVQVFFDGVAAPVLYAQSRQVNAQAPSSLSGSTVVTLKYNGRTFGPFSMLVAFADPEIFLRQAGLSTQALAFNQDNTVNGPDNPAPPGSVVYFFGTGFGQTNPPCSAGGLNVPTAADLAGVTVTVAFGGGTVVYAGSAPTLACGVAQINMQVPASATSGINSIGLQAQMAGNRVNGNSTATIVVK